MTRAEQTTATAGASSAATAAVPATAAAAIAAHPTGAARAATARASTPLTRVTILVNDQQIDATAPSNVPIRVFITDLVDTLRATYASNSAPPEPSVTGLEEAPADPFLIVGPGAWSLAALGEPAAIPRHLTLDEAEIFDGAVLTLSVAKSGERFVQIVEELTDALAEYSRVLFRPFNRHTARYLGFGALLAGAPALALLFIRAWLSTPSALWFAIPAAALGLIAWGSALVAHRRWMSTLTSYSLAVVSLPLLFVGAALAVPAPDNAAGQFTSANYLAGFTAVAVASLLICTLTTVGIATHTAVVVFSILCAIAAAMYTYTGLGAPTIPAGLVVVSLTVLAYAPKLSTRMARIKPPYLPAPGEQFETGKTLSEAFEMFDPADGPSESSVRDAAAATRSTERRTRDAGKYLTGVLLAAAIATIVGVLTSIRPGTYYARIEFALAVVCVLLLALRGRSMTGRAQALMMYFSSMVLTVGVAAIAVSGYPRPAVQLAVIGITAAAFLGLALAGIIKSELLGATAPEDLQDQTRLDPPMRRWIERLESLLIVSSVPLALWEMGVFNYLRNLF